MFLQKKKKRLRERTRLSEEITTLNVTVTQHCDLAPFLFCALFALRPFCRTQMWWIEFFYQLSDVMDMFSLLNSPCLDNTH